MTLQDWIDETGERIDNYGWRQGGVEAAKAFWTGAICRFGEHVYNWGTPIWERDWEVLLVLDTCRPDVLEEVAREYTFVPDRVPTHTSNASASIEWVRKNLAAEQYADEVSQTAYVSANLFTEELDPNDLAYLDEVWSYGWDDDVYTTPPDVVADRAISVARDPPREFDRLVVHFMQPHAPYRKLVERYPEWFSAPSRGDDPSHPAWELWERLRHDVISYEEVWDAYRDNLHWVLQDGVEPVLNNLDSDDVVITSDHAEAFGEWGVYAHPPYAPVPVLKEVPWVRTTATDSGEYEPTVEPEEKDVSDQEMTDRLEALGYKE